MRAKHPDRHTYLTQTPIPGLIWALAVPTIISMLVTGIYNTADTYFVGRISTEATAAVGLVFSVQAIIQALGFFCGHGSGNCLSRMLGAVMNIGLDPLLMFVFGLGVRGAAIATVCGQITSFIALIIGSRRGENLRLNLKNVRMNLSNLLQIVNGGMPSLARQGLAAVSTLLLNRYARIYGGDAAIAGMSIVTRVLMLNVSVLIGFGQAYQPVCSYNYGAGLYTRVREGYRYCVKYGTVMMTTAGILCVVFAPTVVGWFRDDPDVIPIGAAALRWQAAVLPLLTTSILTNMMLQSMGKGVKASITSSARNGIFFIPLILILPHFFGLAGVEMTQAWADVLTFLLAVPMAYSELKHMKTDRIPEGGKP